MVLSSSARRGDDEAKIIVVFFSGILICRANDGAFMVLAESGHDASAQLQFCLIWRFPLRRKISLLLIVAFIAALAILNNGCSQSEPADSDDASVSFDLNEPKIKERLGKDDGYAFSIMYGADIHGSLETCG